MNGLESFLYLPDDAKFTIEFIGSRVAKFEIEREKEGFYPLTHKGILNLKRHFLQVL